MRLPLGSILPLRPYFFGERERSRSPEVHRTAGTRRVFRQFVWLEAGSGKMALARAARYARIESLNVGQRG